ncbi:MAG: GNAT family N-acetyltransferase [Lewinellaceae bacterium]|nr:GNAT family N-acetyltransferase [Lewinellaceae bacterium]
MEKRMDILQLSCIEELNEHPSNAALKTFIEGHPESNFFQGVNYFAFSQNIPESKPVLLFAQEGGRVVGSLLGTIQSNGNGLKSWLSRRIIVWGGPLVADDKPQALTGLLEELHRFAAGKSLFIEFRNAFDTTSWQENFIGAGYEYRPHLNYLVRTDSLDLVKQRMSKSRWRQIQSSLRNGAEIVEPESEQDVLAFYQILLKLYEEKVKKPLYAAEFFLKFWKSDAGKIFLVKKDGEVLGGIVCPIHQNRIIYEWYVCGEDGKEKGISPSVLATWAPIDYAIRNGMDHFDFMGAGQPDQAYSVRDFKERFGGDQVCFGRYHLIVNKALYQVGKLGLRVYQKVM